MLSWTGCSLPLLTIRPTTALSPRTYASDKDPLDVLVLCSEQIQPMTIVECAPIGVLMMEDGGAKDEKIIAVPVNDPNYNCYTNIDQLPAHYFEEIKHFF